MPKQEYLSFLKFDNEDEMLPYIKVLQDNNINFITVDESYSTDPLVGTLNTQVKDFRIKLFPNDFDKANALLENTFKEQLSAIDNDYFLFEFTDDELIDVVKKPDEWGHLNFMLARQLLKQRGKTIDDKEIEKFEEERNEELRQTEKSSSFWVVMAYILAILGAGVLFFGIVAIFIGWQLSSLKKTLPNGDRVYVYSHNDRIHGSRIYFIAIVSTIVGFILALAVYAMNHDENHSGIIWF